MPEFYVFVLLSPCKERMLKSYGPKGNSLVSFEVYRRLENPARGASPRVPLENNLHFPALSYMYIIYTLYLTSFMDG